MSPDSINEREILDFYERQLTSLDEQQAKLEADRAAVLKIVTGIRERLSSGNGWAAAVSTEEDEIPPDAFKGLTVLEAATKYLRMVKVGQSSRQISQALLKGGYESTSKNFFDTVRVRLRDWKAPKGPFVSINGLWELTAWHQQAEGEKENNLPL